MSFTYNAELYKQTFEKEVTYLNGFLRNVYRYPNKIALIEPSMELSLTYAELNKECNKLANAIKDEGSKKNDIITMQLFNSPQFVYGYIASHKLGMIANPINFNLSPGETAEILDHNKSLVYIYDFDIRQIALKALELCSHKPKVIIEVNNSDKSSDLPLGHILYEEYVANMSTENPQRDFEVSVYDETVRLQTSGTTSTPKGVPLNNINEIMSAHNLIMDLGLTSNSITMNLTPWFHRGGIHSTGPTTVFYIGCTTVILRSFNPKLCLNYMEKYRISHITAVPAVLHPLCARIENHPVDISSLKAILSMGAPLEKEACIKFMNLLTPNIFNGYGTTESLWNLFMGPEDLPEKSGITGKASMDDDVRLVKIYSDKKADYDDTVAKDNTEIGEIIIKCPLKTAFCYADNPQMTTEKFHDGWLYTGDAGVWNEEQYITIVGRKDDMIISMGENIYPARIEEILNRHPKISESLVTGVHDDRKGEIVVAYIISSDNSLTVSDVIDYCSKSPYISHYQAPKYYCFTDNLPHTATGKKQHYIAKKQAQKDYINGLFKRK